MISVSNLTKIYGSVVALDKISFKIEKGEILGFLGPNGAGKSTAMKIITTYIAATEGEVFVDNMDINKNPIEVRKKIGYLPENSPVYKEMNVKDYLTFVARARELPPEKIKERLDWVIQATGLESELRKDIGELSKGFKQRTGLAQALIHDPEVLVLDEPTSGLDPLQIIDIRKLIKDLAKEKTIIFSTHILQEVDAITDRVLIINEGRIAANGYLQDLKLKAAAYQTTFLSVLAPFKEVEAELKKISSINKIRLIEKESSENRTSLKITSPANKDIKEEIGRIISLKGWQIISLFDRDFSLEETFINLIRKSKSQGEN
ncbi:MAG: ATP-binding cassette domain-containing protein [Candidatus Coatesbacteria bacterium]|nr:ATP-binding cassette domain-containing protein [Candidatus Coatesbacteria bacterium]